MDGAHTILLVEDDDATRTFLADNLTADGFDMLVADCVRDGRRLLEAKFPDLVVVDVVLPDAAGLDLVREVRSADGIASRLDPHTPVLVLSGRSSELDRLRGFERGADDYVVKPFALEELLARLRALLRRTNGDAGERLSYTDLTLDPATREVHRGERPVELTKTEFALLEHLLRHPRLVLTRSQLFEAVWGYDFGPRSNSLEVYIGYLRRKTEEGGEPRLIQTVRGVGYSLRETGRSSASPAERPRIR